MPQHDPVVVAQLAATLSLAPTRYTVVPNVTVPGKEETRTEYLVHTLDTSEAVSLPMDYLDQAEAACASRGPDADALDRILADAAPLDVLADGLARAASQAQGVPPAEDPYSGNAPEGL